MEEGRKRVGRTRCSIKTLSSAFLVAQSVLCCTPPRIAGRPVTDEPGAWRQGRNGQYQFAGFLWNSKFKQRHSIALSDDD